MKDSIVAITFWTICLFSICNTAIAQTPLVEVYAQHYGGAVQYRYRIVNNGMFSISSVWIGYNTFNDSNRSNDVFELKTLPLGMDIFDIPAASRESPLGWDVVYIGQEETFAHSIKWRVIDGNAAPLAVGATLNGMRITLGKMDSSYVSGHATIHFSNRPASEDISVPLQLLDTTPPKLTLTLSPNILQPNDKLTWITANISARDDYDPAPEIKLESITSNDQVREDDIRDARLGTDDRQFMLKAKNANASKVGRIYTVTYSATDASGNQTRATASITVSHNDNHKNNGKSGRD